eukprot:4037835-Pleurochrysis_carterae.AAC.1
MTKCGIQSHDLAVLDTMDIRLGPATTILKVRLPCCFGHGCSPARVAHHPDGLKPTTLVKRPADSLSAARIRSNLHAQSTTPGLRQVCIVARPWRSTRELAEAWAWR